MEITKPGLIRLARKAGIKSLSEDCFPILRSIIQNKLENIIRLSLIINSEHITKTLMTDNVYDALSLSGEHIAQSKDIGTQTFTK